MKKTVQIILIAFLLYPQWNFAQAILDDFNVTIKGSPNIQGMDMQTDGKIVLGGDITMHGNDFVNGIIRINTDGTLDRSFTADISLPHNELFSLLTTSSNKTLLLYNGLNMENAILLNPDGSIDTEFDIADNLWNIQIAHAISDGFLVYGFLQGTGDAIVKINMSGSIDDTFQPVKIDGFVWQIFQNEDNEVFISGNINKLNDNDSPNLAKINADGLADTSFLPDAPQDGAFLTFQFDSNDKIYLRGQFSVIGNHPVPGGFARLNTDGSFDDTFLSSVSGNLYSQGVQKAIIRNQEIIVLGINSNNEYVLAQLNTDGSLISSLISFSRNPSQKTNILSTSDGKIIVGGGIKSSGETPVFSIAQINDNGEIESSFDPKLGRAPQITSSTIQTDGKVIITGKFYEVNGIRVDNIARLNVDGSLDESFQLDLNTSQFVVLSSGLQSDGKIIIGGNLNIGYTDNLLRLNADGSTDQTFLGVVLGNTSELGVNNLYVTEADEIIISGHFYSINNVTRRGLAKLSAEGELISTFNTSDAFDLNEYGFFSMEVQNNGKILLGGLNLNSNGFLLRVDEIGEIDQSFNSKEDLDFSVKTITSTNNGSFVVGGTPFTSQSSVPLPLSQFDADGVIQNELSVGVLISRGIPNYSDVFFLGDDEIVVSGKFNKMNGFERTGLAKVGLNGIVDQYFEFNMPLRDSRIINAGEDNIFVFGSFSEVNGKNIHGGVKIKVVNDVPGLDGLLEAVEIDEDSEFELELMQLVVIDEDDEFPSDFTFTILEGEGYSVNGNIIVPAENFNGKLTIGIEIEDPKGDKGEGDIEITVLAVNDAPIVSEIPTILSLDEDGTIDLSLSDFTVSDVDNNLDELTLVILDGDNYTFDGTTVIPDTNFNGSLTVNTTVSDGTDVANEEEVTITVNPINDAPKILIQLEEPSLFSGRENEILLSTLETEDVDGDVLTVKVLDGNNYTVVSGSIISIAKEFEGDLVINVQVTDGELESEIFVYNASSEFVLTGVDEHLNHKLKVYPNPVSDILTLEYEQHSKLSSIRLYDIAGGLIRDFEISGQPMQELDMKNLSNGAYYLRVWSESKVLTRKIILQ